MSERLDFPVALQLSDKPVLMVGAGKIAEGRVRQLLEVGARVHVVAPAASAELKRLAEEKRIQLSQRPYARGDCAGVAVVFTAAEASEVNRAVVAEARERGILVNAADLPELCDFHLPSIGRRGPVTIAVSTSGKAPGLARVIRDRTLAAVGPEYGQLARLLGRLRRLVPGGPLRTRALQAIIDGGGAVLLARGDRQALWRLVRRVCLPASALQPETTEALTSGDAP